MRSYQSRTSSRGFTILEVIVAIVLFAVGVLALASLQGALTRSMVDSRVRTVAANVAEETIEHAAAFQQLLSGGGVPAFNDIVSGTSNRVVDGIGFTITQNVADYYYQVASDSFTTVSNGALNANYKQVSVTVSWDSASRNFRGQSEGTELAAADLGTGSVTVTASIPALVTSASAKVADETESSDKGPQSIVYTPGENPDVISLSLGDNKFKESLTPLPEVCRTQDQVETKFDVVTYSSSASGDAFVRREDFGAVSCECELHGPDASAPGRRPVLWAGDEYVAGQFVTKAFGVSANSEQSNLCETCCRDHHDGGTSSDDSTDSASNVYGPFKGSGEYFSSGTFSGDHKHYKADGSEAASGDIYLEACRLVRVYGFYRVAQDFRQEDRYVFPADFMDDGNEVTLYSDYVTGAVNTFEANTINGYESSPPCIGLTGSGCVATPTMNDPWSDPIDVDAGGNPIEFPSWTTLPFGPAGDLTEQLRSRGIYIDYMSDDLRAVIDCLKGGSPSVDTCKSGDVVLDQVGSLNPLEVIPFFDVQLTLLNRWNETPFNSPIDTTNEPLQTGNTHSRGVISRDAVAEAAIVKAKGHRGNLGFTDTPAIDPLYDANVREATIEVQSLDSGGAGGTVPSTVGVYFSGSLSETVSGSPTIILSGLNGVSCDQTSANYECFIPDGTVSPQLLVSGYGKNNATRYACSGTLVVYSQSGNTTTSAQTVFSLDGVTAATDYDIVIQNATCPAL